MHAPRLVPAVAIATSLFIAGCSYAPRAVLRNDSGGDIALWPLSGVPMPVKAGETTRPIGFQAYEQHQAMIERDGCLYTYPAPTYSALPKRLKAYAAAVVVVIRPDMKLAVHARSKDGAEGEEIIAGGFPITPTRFCGRHG